ncbi:hypothetical protein DXG01_007056 [Tephrocybe rancida]|nr:hypothetical protein DXG01_007056 [Tephrocybe rancida]
MAPPPWATPAQLALLNSKMATYISLKTEHVNNHSNQKMSDFLEAVTRELNVLWPELEASGKGNHNQVMWWFCNKSRAALGTQEESRQSNTVLASLVWPQKRCRVHKVIEKYQMMHHKKICSLLEPWIIRYHKKYGMTSLDVLEAQYTEEDWEELDDDNEDNTQAEDVDTHVDGADTARIKQIKTTRHFRSYMLQARSIVAQKAWQEESQQERACVLQAIEEEKAEMLALLDMEKEGLERDPEQRQL